MISTELKQVILKSLNLDNWEINDDTLAEQVPGWDSLNHVNVILAVEEHFDVHFRSREVLTLRNIGDLQRLLDSKLGGSGPAQAR
jgi:acyl carrier protein